MHGVSTILPSPIRQFNIYISNNQTEISLNNCNEQFSRQAKYYEL